ncbi:preprotein translocase subunit YajC [Curvivirga aplysinae]|uniref:preprotein translocase subunit YajC n=1 Tax=Curvivirga aplysinae TaxID=2529852 RepID=UPI0012BCA5BC|nr:preprotein translocase subunit YajC [Curvivirga aplysinae]MTI10710.1 preprotein translocase subunit YajC [Curvivirga aplysinae]
MSMISSAYAQAAGGAAGGDMFGAFLPLILIFVVFYFLLIRPQQKKQKAHQQKLSAVRRGDKIITGGGFYGTVTKIISDTEIQVEIAEGVKVKVASATIMDVLSKSEPANDAAPAAEEKKGGLGGLFGKKKD